MGKPEGKNHLEDPGIDGRTVLRWIFGKWVGGSIDWIDLVEDRDRCWPCVDMMINPKVP